MLDWVPVVAWLGSRILPRTWDRSKLPKTLAMLGGLVGTAPGIAALASSAANGDVSGADALFGDGPPDVRKFHPTVATYPPAQHRRPCLYPTRRTTRTAPLPAPPSSYRVIQAAVEDVLGDRVHPIVKKAISQTGYELDYNPIQIPSTGSATIYLVTHALSVHYRCRCGRRRLDCSGPSG